MPRAPRTESERAESQQRRKIYNQERQKGRGRTPAQVSTFSPPFSYELLSTARIDNRYQTRIFHLTLQYEILSNLAGEQSGVSINEIETFVDSFLVQCVQSFRLEQEYYRSPLSAARRPTDGQCPRCEKEPCQYCCRLDCSETCEFAPIDPSLVDESVQTVLPLPSEIIYSL